LLKSIFIVPSAFTVWADRNLLEAEVVGATNVPAAFFNLAIATSAVIASERSK
jgi:hypothetical protein